MGLTKPRAYQIFDIDYKQAVRVITLTNITLSGGAPSTVDGVSLNIGSRILVAGQSTGSQNGVYQVSVLGTGSNGTWIRSVDTNESGELNAGTIVMVTEGVTYKDTQWKLTTNDPIVIGTTALVFEQNSAFAFGNIYANSTAVLADIVGDTVTFTPANNMVILANATSDTINFEVSQSPNFSGNFQVSGTVGSNLIPSANIVYNLGNTTNRWNDIWLANSTIYLGNAQISANATSLILTTPQGAQTVLSGTTANVSADTVTATGNVTGGNLITSGVLSVTGNANVGNLGTAGLVTATGNITSAGNVTVGNAVFTTSDTAIQGWSFGGVSLSITATEGTPQGLYFGNSGASFYVVGSGNDRVYQYNMSTVNMANTGVLFGNVSVASQDSVAADIYIDSTGANLYIMGQTNDTVFQYSLSTPWNITTATYASKSFSVATQEATPTGIWFKPDLTVMYVVGNTSDTVFQYNLSSAGNVATATYANKSFSVATQIGTPVAVQLSSDGTVMWILGQDQDAIFEYNLSTPWDVSTASYTAGRAFGFWAQGETAALGLYVDTANSRAWMVGSTNDTIYQYDTLGSVILRGNAIGLQSSLTVGGNAYVAGRLQVDQAARFESSLTVDSTLTATSTLSLTGTSTGSMALGTSITTANANIFTSQTTGNFLLGGTAATGTINIGRSTANQAILIGNGITASGSVKTIDIGTLGASGSTTNISVGPVAGNGTVSFLANAIVSIANSLSVSGNANITGNVSGANLLLSGNIFDSGTSLQINTTSAANIALAPNSSIVLVATTTGANITGTLNATGNANVGNLGTAGLVVATGNVTGGNLVTAGRVDATGNITGGNLVTAGLVSAGTTITATGNVTGGNIVTAGQVTATGNVTGGNLIGTNIIGTLTTAAQTNITSVGTLDSLSVTGNVGSGNISGTRGAFTTVTGTLETAAQPNVTSVGTLTSLTATGNVSGGNLVTTGTVTTGTLTASGNVTVAGNLTVSGNVISVNVTNLNVVDPIIGLGRGANNTPLTSNDGKDRGQELWYYTTTEQAAFMGYDNSAGKLIAATNVSVSNDVVTVNNYGNLIVGGLESATISATGNANVGNLGATTVTATTLTGTISTAAQTNITSVGTLTSLAVTGNVTSGNFVGTLNGSGANVSSISADNISSGTLAQARLANAAVTLGSTALTLGATVTTVAGLTSVTSTTFVGDLTGAATTAGTVTTAAQPNITSVGTLTSLGVTGNITSGNLSGTLITGTLTTAAQPNISSLGTLTSLTASGNVTGGNLTTGAQVVATGNITGGNLITSGVLSVTGNANVGNLGASTIVATTLTGTLNTAAQPNITSLGTLTSLDVTGNVTGGNLTTGSQVIATGNVSGGNITTAGRVDATGNITGGNLVTTGQLVATGNVTGALIKASSNVEIQNRGILFLNDSDNSNYIGLRSPATLTGNFTYIFPSGYGNAAQVLTTNGAGGLTWEDQSGGGGGGGATQYPNSTVQPVPGSTGNFDLSYNFVQTVQEAPFESSATDPFGVNLGEVYSMMDPVGEVLEGVDLGVLT